MSRRIRVAIVLACTLGLSVLLVPTSLALRSKNDHADLLEMQEEASAAASALRLHGLEAWSPDLLDASTDHDFGVYAADGTRLSGRGPVRADQTAEAAAHDGAATARTDTEIVAATAVTEAGTSYVVRAAEPVAESTWRTLAETAALIGLGLLALGAATVGGRMLVARIMRPMRELRRAVERAGDGGVLVSVPTTKMAEIDEIGDALVTSHRRLLASLARERDLAVNASHQLRTPLTAAIAAVETELLAPRTNPRLVLEEELGALLQLQGTVEDLLELNRRRGTLPSPRPHLDDTLRRAHAHWHPLFVQRARNLHLDLPHPLPPVQVSPGVVTQVLDVLVHNALEHGVGTATLSARHKPDRVIITVDDHGPGPAHPETLFTRADPHASGTGIGLAMARDLAESEGARLAYRKAVAQPQRSDDVGGTSRFELLIPLTGHP